VAVNVVLPCEAMRQCFTYFIFRCFWPLPSACDYAPAGLLLRPEHTHTVRPRPRPRPDSARPRSRPRLRPKICYETETKNYETETETSPVKSIACESNPNRYVSFFSYTHEVNDEPEMDFAF